MTDNEIIAAVWTVLTISALVAWVFTCLSLKGAVRRRDLEIEMLKDREDKYLSLLHDLVRAMTKEEK